MKRCCQSSTSDVEVVHNLLMKFGFCRRRRRAEEAKVPEAKRRNDDMKMLCTKEAKLFKAAAERADITKKEARIDRDRHVSLMNRLEAAVTDRLLARQGVITQELGATKQRNDRDQARIVQSPDRLKRTIGNLATSVEQERASIEQNKARTREYQAKLSQLSNIEQVSISDSRGCDRV